MENKTYYFSSKGHFGGDGSKESPFCNLHEAKKLDIHPGDSILLERGSVFERQWLHLHDHVGTKERPIVVGCYGKGALPVIRTEGLGLWYQDYGTKLDSSCHVWKGYVSSAVLLYDCANIRVENLEITNEPAIFGECYDQGDKMNRTGVAVVAQNGGTLENITLTGLYVHGVKGNVYDKHMNNGGIYCTALKPKKEDGEIARYHRLRIEKCRVENCSRWGIAAGYSYTHSHFTTAKLPETIVKTYGHTEVVIEHNLVKNIGGDGITVMYCFQPLVQYNVSEKAAMEINDKIYTEAGARQGKTAAAIWPWKCKDALFQYNEAYHTCDNQDGQAWDADSGDGTVYQYNYSYGNEGGCVMFCLEESVNNVFRYNVSVSEKGGVMNPAKNPDAHVYGNIFVMAEGIPFIRHNMSGGYMLVENNVIINTGKACEMDWHHQSEYFTYRHNRYVGYENVPREDGEAKEAELTEQEKKALEECKGAQNIKKLLQAFGQLPGIDKSVE